MRLGKSKWFLACTFSKGHHGVTAALSRRMDDSFLSIPTELLGSSSSRP
ncbi:MAG: hypothetical protein PVI26_08115 [Chitinispirillia bacterium]